MRQPTRHRRSTTDPDLRGVVRAELSRRGRVHDVVGAQRSERKRRQVFLLCRLAPEAPAIPGRFSSSSLPPSFARGRGTADFPARGTANGGAPQSLRQPGARGSLA